MAGLNRRAGYAIEHRRPDCMFSLVLVLRQ